MKLTKEYCLGATRVASAAQVEKLNLWGCDIEDMDCIKDFPNLRVLSFSMNHITSMAACAHLPKLEEIFLRNNKITDWNELRHLAKLSKLQILWLRDNPIATSCDRADYRKRILSVLPNLLKIDEHDVTPEERSGGRNLALAGKIEGAGANRKNGNRAELDQEMERLRDSQANLVKGMVPMFGNIKDVQAIDLLMRELSVRKAELSGAGPI